MKSGLKREMKEINRIIILKSKKQTFTLLQKTCSIPLYSIDIGIFVNCNWVDTRWQ